MCEGVLDTLQKAVNVEYSCRSRRWPTVATAHTLKLAVYPCMVYPGIVYLGIIYTLVWRTVRRPDASEQLDGLIQRLSTASVGRSSTENRLSFSSVGCSYAPMCLLCCSSVTWQFHTLFHTLSRYAQHQ